MNIIKGVGLLLSCTQFLMAQQKTNQPILAPSILPGGNDKWELFWNDEFDYPNEELDKRWKSQNGPSGHILCSRWRENAVVSDGTLKLLNKKENRGGQEWTSGNIWTHKHFLYGYYECRYKYAPVEATNNSFWIMSMTKEKITDGKYFEIDINEGHYPNEVNTNIHNWTDPLILPNGRRSHPSFSKSFPFGVKADCNIQLEIPIVTKRLRFQSKNGSHFHIKEFRAYNVNQKGYPEPLSPTADQDVVGLVNYVREKGTSLTCSGVYYDDKYSIQQIADGSIDDGWVTQPKGNKWLEVEFADNRAIGCIQFVNGWKDKGGWGHFVNDYAIQYHNGKDWVDISTLNVETNGAYNFAKEFHTFGLDWSREELVFYVDGKEIRRWKNEFCYTPAPVWLSLAIIPWGGAITDAIDGTAMEVDYVRIYKRK